MKSKYIISTLIIISTLTLSACGHKHQFSDATCTTPATCLECHETEGEPLEHNFTEATCTTAKTCESCGLTEGAPTEHQWLEATTETPKTCSSCGLTEGAPLPAVKEDDETNASILEDYKAMYERGEISKETYEFMVDFNEEADNFIKENGSTSTAEVDNSMNQASSNTVTIPDELLEGAVTKPAGEGDGSGYVEHGSGDYSGLEHIRSN